MEFHQFLKLIIYDQRKPMRVLRSSLEKQIGNSIFLHWAIPESQLPSITINDFISATLLRWLQESNKNAVFLTEQIFAWNDAVRLQISYIGKRIH